MTSSHDPEPVPSAPRDRRRTDPSSRARAVVAVGVAMIVLQLAYRAWASYGGWFLIDDFAFLARAVDQDLDADYLFTPYGDHLQPIGFLIAWVVGQSQPYDWTLASSITLAVQAVASTACFVFLLRLAGTTWRALVPLAFYLFGVTTLPGFMWWAAAVVQVPLQAAAFVALTAHLEYLRSGRRWWIALTAAALGVGMLCDVKVLFLALVIAFMSLYLNDGSGLLGRLREVLARWQALVPLGLMFVAYLVAYVTLNPSVDRGLVAPVAIFDTMLRFVLGPLLLGGPWRWGPVGDTPLAAPATPEWAVTATWVVLALLVARVARRRPAATWVLALLVVAVVANAVMLSIARGAVFGGDASLEVRYVGDLAPVLVVVVAVLVAPLAPRRPPAVPPGPVMAGVGSGRTAGTRPGRREALVGLGTAAAVVGALASSTLYVENWHAPYPARTFFQNVVAQAEERPLVLIDQQVPLEVLPRQGSTDFEVPSQVFTPLGDRIIAGARMNDPDVLSPEGIAYPAAIDVVRQSPPGPREGCGYVVRQRQRSIPVDQASPDAVVGEVWWASIGYLASEDGVVTLTFNGLSTDMEVTRGLHDYFFLGSGPGDEITLESRSDVTLCVDNVRVGTLKPLETEEAP